MRSKFLVYVALVLAFASNVLLAQEQKVRVFILAGQSNMVGQGVVAQLPREMRQLPPNVAYYQRTEGKTIRNFTSLKNFGPEVAFAHELAAAYPHDKILLIKHAVGGTSLLAWSPEWTAQKAALTENESDGPLYHQLQLSIAKATKGLNFEFDGVIWEQGGREIFYAGPAHDYGKNLKRLIEAFRRDTHTPNLPFIYGTVTRPPHPPARYAKVADNMNAVEAGQIEVSKEVPHTSLVDTSGMTFNKTHVHFDTKGQLELGRRFARAYLELVNAPAAPPSH